MIKLWRDHIRSTLAIDPAEHSPEVSSDRIASFGYALAGIIHMLRYATNLRIQLAAALGAVVMGLWLHIGRTEWGLLIMIITLNIFAEFINAAVEAAVNLASPEWHPLPQLAKDVAAGAVLVMTLASIAIGLVVFGPILWERLT